jgi:hypothetical protein
LFDSRNPVGTQVIAGSEVKELVDRPKNLTHQPLKLDDLTLKEKQPLLQAGKIAMALMEIK